MAEPWGSGAPEPKVRTERAWWKASAVRLAAAAAAAESSACAWTPDAFNSSGHDQKADTMVALDARWYQAMV